MLAQILPKVTRQKAESRYTLPNTQGISQMPVMPNVDSIIRYESGEMDDDEVVSFFQELIDSGMAWRLQGSYGRMAQRLINDGLCSA